MRVLMSSRLHFITALIIALVGSSQLPVSNAEFYSSIYKMSLLVKYEHIFLHHMQKYITENENKIDYLKERLQEFERERNEALDEGATYFDSPVNRFLLTKRLTMDWERIENLMEQRGGQKHLKKLEHYKNTTTMPDQSELIGAIDGLLHIQDIYRLRTSDIAAGILDGIHYNFELEGKHCFDIAKRAMEENKLKFAHSWLLETMNRYEDPDEILQLSGVSFNEFNIISNFIEVKTKLGDIFGVNYTYAEWLLSEPDNTEVANAYIRFMDSVGPPPYNTVDLTDEHDPIPQNIPPTDQFNLYKFTCNGILRPPPSEERDLRCGYVTENHPFLLLAPIKVEEINHNPLLVVFHDVLSDSEAETLQDLANKDIQRATVMSNNGSVVSSVRTSQFTFIRKTRHPLLEKVDERVEDMTNLNMDYAEDHQFSNYGVGGLYLQHHDYFLPSYFQSEKSGLSSPQMGDRIATVLFYLTDVEQGGGTAFPFLKKKLMPKKGSAAFWYNLHASGNGDLRTLHGACPIITGSKWVQNRWIRQFFQDDRRPCELHDDTIPIWY